MLIRIIIYCETYKVYSKIRIVLISIYFYLKKITKRYSQKNKLDEKVIIPSMIPGRFKTCKGIRFHLNFLVLTKTSYP